MELRVLQSFFLQVIWLNRPLAKMIENHQSLFVFYFNKEEEQKSPIHSFFIIQEAFT